MVRSLHGVRRLPGGMVRVRLSEREHELLASLPDQLRAILGEADTPEDLRARLFPRVYEDPLEELEHRPFDEGDLAAERLAAVDVFAETLGLGRVGRLGWTVDLDGEQAGAWLSAVNDARLALGVTLGITTESQWEDGPDPDEPASVALWYLGWLQEQLVQALMSALDEDGGSEPQGPTIG